MKTKLTILGLLSTFSLIGNALAQVYTSTDPVIVTASPSCPGIGTPNNSDIEVTGTGLITNPNDVNINMNIYSSCAATIKMYLIAPNGDSCLLMNTPHRISSCSTNVCAMFDEMNTITFNATSTNLIPEVSFIPTGHYAPTGSDYAPEIGDLTTFLMGKEINGTWSLVGHADADVNLEINSWSIEFGPDVLSSNLLDFNARANNGYNELKWSVDNIENIHSFLIERSVDLVNFETIETILTNTTSIKNYSFQDHQVSASAFLYRLRIQDHSGEVNYSNTIKVFGNNVISQGLTLAPNPANDIINILIHNPSLINTPVSIYNAMGQLVHTVILDKSNYALNIDFLSEGIYSLRLKNGETYRLVKIK